MALLDLQGMEQRRSDTAVKGGGSKSGSSKSCGRSGLSLLLC